MPNEPPAEIKALIDTVLGGFNRKDSREHGLGTRCTTALSVKMLSSSKVIVLSSR
jgi:predicted GNAT family acetyltransferase